MRNIMDKKIKGRILAVDLGLKRVGLAISDELHIVATALDNLIVSGKVEEDVVAFLTYIEKLKEEKGFTIGGIAIGLPMKLDGSDSPMTQHVRAFYKKLLEKTEKKVLLLDERLTSVQADRSLKEASLTRKKRAKFVDRISAVILLQSFFEKEDILCQQ